MHEFELVALKSGVMSLRALGNRETFHPVTGPRIEASILHVEQQQLVARAQAAAGFVIWDVGLGAAANALVAIEALSVGTSEVELHSFDKTTAPLEFALAHARELGYLEPHSELLKRLLAQQDVVIRPGFRWRLHLGDFSRQLDVATDVPAPNAIFYDPYAPLGNPEMWSLDHFRALHQSLEFDRPCLITNYTCSTAVRVTLLLAGFYVGRGCSVGEKRETTIASNRLELLERPLDQRWLETVRISGNAAPLSDVRQAQSPISVRDLGRLVRCRQFR